jgi:dihydroneopterin aldolase
MGTISLEGMIFFAHPGCFDEEQVIGTQFAVDLHVEADLSKATSSDNIQDTLNYQQLYNLVQQEMSVPSRLLEHVAGRIAHSAVEKMPRIERITVKVAKLNPPLGGQVAASSVCITCEGKGALAK